VVLTGAGISTRSGIPDFRSPGTGLWNYSDPLEVASIWGFREDPERFYRWIRPLAKKMVQAKPNPAHLALFRLQTLNLVRTIITQNIDDLHQMAGCTNVLQVHGSAHTVSCMQCKHQEASDALWRATLEKNFEVPHCSECGGLLKPDVVLFGEELPAAVLEEAQQAALSCDLMIVAGSSLEVMPVADLPFLARRRGARLVIINLGRTMADSKADVVFHDDVAEVLPRLVRLCEQQIQNRHSSGSASAG
jgi:NAD-dependent deacetylase